MSAVRPTRAEWQRALLVPQPLLNVGYITAMAVQWAQPRYWPPLLFAIFPLWSLWLSRDDRTPRPFVAVLAALLELAWTVITMLVVTLVAMVAAGMG